MSGPAGFKFGTTSNFTEIFVASDKSVTFYQPIPAEGYKVIGSYPAVAPIGPITTLSVINDDPAAPLLVPPAKYNLLLGNGETGFNIWYPQAPPNYVTLGFVCTNGKTSNKQPPPDSVWCCRADKAEEGELIEPPFKSGVYEFYRIHLTNVLYFEVNITPPFAPAYVPKGLAQIEKQARRGKSL